MWNNYNKHNAENVDSRVKYHRVGRGYWKRVGQGKKSRVFNLTF